MTRRVSNSLVDPAYEDAGIFKNPIVEIIVEIIPEIEYTQRNDLILRGFLDRRNAIDVVFAGRRADMARPLVHNLRQAWTKANNRARYTSQVVEKEHVRVELRVQGAWRPRFDTDEDGWQTRRHQFYAAQWFFVAAADTPRVFGAPKISH